MLWVARCLYAPTTTSLRLPPRTKERTMTTGRMTITRSGNRSCGSVVVAAGETTVVAAATARPPTTAPRRTRCARRFARTKLRNRASSQKRKRNPQNITTISKAPLCRRRTTQTKRTPRFTCPRPRSPLSRWWLSDCRGPTHPGLRAKRRFHNVHPPPGQKSPPPLCPFNS